MVSVESTVETGHEDMIHDAQMDYYGTRLATCSSDRSVRIFDVKEGGVQTVCADLRGHEGPVWQVAWANPKFGNILASCSYDRKVILWREDSPGRWNKLYEHNAHDSSVNSVSFAPPEFGLMLAAGSSDGSISILSYSDVSNSWETDKIPNAHTIGVNAVSWAPNTAATQQVRRFVSGGCDNLAKVWRFDSGTDGRWVEEAKLEAHSDWVRDVAWAPSVGANRNVIATCSQDRRVLIWTSEESTSTWTPKTLHTFDDVAWHVSWSVSGNLLAVSGGDNRVTLWKESLAGQWVSISGGDGKREQQPLQQAAGQQQQAVAQG